MPYVLNKWNATALYDEVGRRWSISKKTKHLSGGQIQTQCGINCNKFPRFPKVKDDLEKKKALTLIQQEMNAQRPSWDTLYIKQDKGSNSNTKMKNINPCMVQIDSTVESAVWSIRPPNQKTVPSSFLTSSLIMKTCDAVSQILRYIPLKVMSAQKNLYYVMVISDINLISNELFQVNIIDDISKNGSDGSIAVSLVLIIMGGTESRQEISQWKELLQFRLNKQKKVVLHVIQTSPPFGRSIGLKMGYQYIERNDNSPKKDAIVFSLDASLRLPVQFSQGIVKSVNCGHVAYAPVCKKKNRWVEGAYGMIGMCLSDYVTMDGWREKWWYRWGAEDIDMIAQIQQKLVIFRPRIDRYVHVGTTSSSSSTTSTSNLPTQINAKNAKSKQIINAVTENFGFPSLETSPKSSNLATIASTDSRKRNPTYYKEKNLYPDYLPVVPVSELVEDQNMINEIWSKIKLSENNEQLKFCNRVWSTQMRPEDKTIIYTTWANPSHCVGKSHHVSPSLKKQKQAFGKLMYPEVLTEQHKNAIKNQQNRLVLVSMARAEAEPYNQPLFRKKKDVPVVTSTKTAVPKVKKITKVEKTKVQVPTEETQPIKLSQTFKDEPDKI